MRTLSRHSATDLAQVVKLVDTPASGAGGLRAVEVQVLSWAPYKKASSMSWFFYA